MFQILMNSFLFTRTDDSTKNELICTVPLMMLDFAML